MTTKRDDVAVIGMSGKFPGANTVSEFWENLCAKRESIRVLSDEALRDAGVPERDIADSAYVKAAALLDDVDKFDPAFFKISPLEAELMDPQIRLLLQCAWETLEDAGHARSEAQNIGVFAGAGGVTTSYFANLVNVHERIERVTASPTHLGNDKDFLSTYISYKLNLTGPSMTVQTACSTSLVALHQARQSLLSGECDMALAGGVTVRVPHGHGYLHKEGYIFSKSGRIQSFDAGADGVVFGSGLGLVLIKRLDHALRDGDPIHAVIKGSAIANDGKGKMSYAASSARGQMACVRAALKNAGVDAASIGFVESHGTGTAMGDPEEVKALSLAFKEQAEQGGQTAQKGYCALGAVKANIGHLEAAAGIVGFIKAVLAVKHGVIPPTVHYESPNPRIKFENTPFYVNSTLQKWTEGKRPRRAAVNSLGVGGTNAFVIVEQHVPAKAARSAAAEPHAEPVVVPLSAKTEASLHAQAARLAEFLAAPVKKKAKLDLAEIAYTLQIGRDAMERRAVFVVSTLDELKVALAHYLEGAPIPEAGDSGDNDALITTLAADWAQGKDVDWRLLHSQAAPRRIHLPTYVFAKERHWIEAGSPQLSRALIHPLLHTNTSDLNEQRYSATFTGDEFFLKDHLVRTRQRSDSDSPLQKVLPGVAYLEMARAAIQLSAPAHDDVQMLELRDVVWLQPIVVAQARPVHIAVVAAQTARDAAGLPQPSIDFEVYTQDDHIHCQGRSGFIKAEPRERHDLAQLKATMRRGPSQAAEVYAAFAQMGLSYGPAHRPITSIDNGDRQLLAQLVLPQTLSAGHDEHVLHPSLMDGALQAATTLLFDAQQVPRHPIVPFALEVLRIIAPCETEMRVWARYAPGSYPGDKSAKLDLDLLNTEGQVCVQIRGFSARSLGKETLGSLLATQEWQASDVPAEAAAYAEPHVIVCDLPQIDAQQIARDCTVLQLDPLQRLDQRYSELALACFDKARALFNSRPQGKLLLQLVLPNTPSHALHAGLSGLFKTFRLENPQIAGQIVQVDAGVTSGDLAALLHADRCRPHDTLIRYAQGVRQVAQWRFLQDAAHAFADDSPFRDRGVYLITGGLGGLGMLFANEILARTLNATLVLTGRASLAEINKSPGKKALLDALQAGGATVEYRQLDLADAAQTRKLVAAVGKKHQRLNGVIHAAGMTADGFILKKTAETFGEVLAPKTTGTYNLDLATSDSDLDFLVLFSSLSAAAGNLGQADYAAANGFMDEFAAYRNGLVQAGERRGLTLSIRWPLWQHGGMQPDAAGRDLLHETTGIYPMQTATGMRMFYRSLALGLDQTLVMEGDLLLMQRSLGVGAAIHAARTPDPVIGSAEAPQLETFADAAPATDGKLDDWAESYLCQQLAGLLKLPAHRVDPRSPLEDYGIDSILALDLTRLLEKVFGLLPKTLFFEYMTIRELAGYFVKSHAPTVRTLQAGEREAKGVTASGSVPMIRQTPAGPSADVARAESAQDASAFSIRQRGRSLRLHDERALGASAADAEAIAIVGLSGRYPESPDLQAYWRNLRDGKDCIVEVPKSRWDWRDYYSEDRSEKGRHFSKWGGFIEGVDEFDARFFNISPLEAETLDPQERLFLQHAWMAIEDAGYTRAALQIPKAGDLPGQVGVYAGVMYGEYQLLGAEASLQGQRMGFASNLSSIANRVSYVMNLHGPSMAVDTMCSSSLTAIHLACQDLKLGRTALGIAGGVNITIHPNKYLMLSAGQFISGDGHCQSFGEGGDGYIPGEGVGVVVLKRLSQAQRDGNVIYGVIRGSALSHGGKTNGYTVPNPQAQASAIRQALADVGVDPRHVSYIEAHGTGTKLGDPIEIAALTKAFHESTPDSGFCLIGSAKSNIGHAEAAAGIAGLTKVLLQLKHRQIVPSLHSARLNPHIDFARTPFIVNQQLKTWEAPVIGGRVVPRIAGISSFGAGGSNAHLIVEEYVQPVRAQASGAGTEYIVPLSARTADQLRQKARDLLSHLSDESRDDLASIAWTLQIGREAMAERLAVRADSVARLVARLQSWLDGEGLVEGVHCAQVQAHKDAMALLSQDADLQLRLAHWVQERNGAKLAELWTQGLAIDWPAFYRDGAARPGLISLPTYPFAKQRHWVDMAAAARRAATAVAAHALHPLLHRNSSKLQQLSFSSTFHADDFFLHGEPAQRQLSEVACLEMACAAIGLTMPAQAGGPLELHDVAWAQPGVAVDGVTVTIALFDVHLNANSNDRAERLSFEICREGADGTAAVVICQGRARRSEQAAPAQRAGAEMAAQPGTVWAELNLPAELAQGADEFILHPAWLQAAWQASAALTGGRLHPVAMASLRIVQVPVQSHGMYVWARACAKGGQGIDIDLCDAQGQVCVQMRGLTQATAVVPARPVVPAVVAGDRTKPAAARTVSADGTPTKRAPQRIAFDRSVFLRDASAGDGALATLTPTPVLPKPNRSIALQAPTAVLTLAASPLSVGRVDLQPAGATAGVTPAGPGDQPLQAKPERSIVLAPAESATRPETDAPVAGKPRIALTDVRLSDSISALTSLAPSSSSMPSVVSLFDHGEGIFVIRIDAASGRMAPGVIGDLLSAMRVVEHAASAKALILEGGDAQFLTGGLQPHCHAQAQNLYRALAEFPWPVIAAVRGDALGAGFLIAALSDFMVCSQAAWLGLAQPADGLYPAAAEDLLVERFGRLHATDLLYLTPHASAAELQSRGWSCAVVPPEQVSARALALAESLAKKSQTSLRLLKQHLARRIVAAVQALPEPAALMPADAPATPAAATPIVAPSERLHLEVRQLHTLVVTLRASPSVSEGDAIGLLSDLQTVFTQIDEASPIRSVLLFSDWPGFLPELSADARAAAALACVQTLQSLRRPLLVGLLRDATGLAWYFAHLSEACVYSRDGLYSGAEVLGDPALAGHAAATLALRWGGDVAKQLLMVGAEVTGAALLSDFGVTHVVAADQVRAHALTLADALAAFPPAALSTWVARRMALLEAPAASIGDASVDAKMSDLALPAAPLAIRLGSTVISATAHPEGILEVRMADREAKNMFSDAFSRGMSEVFAHVAESPAYKVVVLTGYDNYFSSGGTPDTLRAIHEGRAVFTDNKVFELPLHCPVPVIAAMQGHGIGAGWAMGMYADFALFSDESRYVSPYMGYGFTPGAGSTLMFPEKIGTDLARETLLTAQEFAGGELKERGLRNPVLPREHVLPAAMVLARRVAQSPRSRLVALKQQASRALQAALPETFAHELAMHERTFVGQADTLARIEGRFGAEASPAAASVPTAASTPATALPVASAATQDLDAGALIDSLRQMLAHELRMPANEIGEDEQFVDLGLDSITGVTWIRRVNEAYGTSIEAIKVYSHPTLAQLAGFVQQQRQTLAGSATAAAPSMVEHGVEALAIAMDAVTLPVGLDDVPTIAGALRAMLAHELRMQENEIGDDEQFVDLGLDSITGVTWVRRINEHYGTSIEAIKVYSHPTLMQLSRHVRDEAIAAAGPVAAALTTTSPARTMASTAMSVPSAQPERQTAGAESSVHVLSSWRRPGAAAAASPSSLSQQPALQPIAVIGMAGQFAKATDLDAFWRNIAEGRDCIEEIPTQRWDIERYYQAGEAAPGKTYSRWMGALDEFDLFDAAFFNISPREAQRMDPQQRLFLQACWHAIEHAGYNPKALAGQKCGVFVGCSAGDYHQLSRREQLSGQGFTGAASSILAARISYFLDLHGPSLSIDTACSSSLVAIASACDSLVLGSSEIALAGGVNVMAGPAMQIMTAQVGMLSPQGRCFTFDERANGIANGEGVGLVMLKRLADAQRDGDGIHGVIEGWGVNQDGKTNGITAPNADSQARLQREVYQRFGIDPASIQLIEAHGTGTALGDPIEVAGLKDAFAGHARDQGRAAPVGHCALSSVKSNIGHCLTAAGVSGVLKVLLALKHQQLPPTLHFQRLNPHIALEGSPFYINDRLREWPSPGNAPRRAAVNSFGFSGTNAHVVIADHPATLARTQRAAVSGRPVIVPLSAHTAEQLQQQARHLLACLKAGGTLDLDRIAYTLQIGREPMNERVAFIASRVDELQGQLQRFAQADSGEAGQAAAAYRAQVSSHKETLRTLAPDADFQTLVAQWIGKRELPRLADLWVKGLTIDWAAFHADRQAPLRIGLPGYPFAKERHWLEPESEDEGFAGALGGKAVNAEAVTVLSPCDDEMFAWVKRREADPTVADIDLYDRDGQVCVQLKGLAWGEAAAMARPAPQGPSTAIADAFAEQAAAVNASMMSMTAAVRPAETASPAISADLLRQQLKMSLADALFMKPSDVDLRKSFTELGLDSIIGVEWVKSLNKQYGTAISATRVYDHPSVSELAAYLQTQIVSRPAVAEPVAQALVSQPPPALPGTAALTQPATAGISLEALQQQLKLSLAEALFMKVSDIDVNKSFTELGLDSIIGVEWVKAINKQFGSQLSATRVYDHPSVKELAAHLQREIGGGPVAAHSPMPAPVPVPVPAKAAVRAAAKAEARAAVAPAKPAPDPAAASALISSEALQQQLKASLAEALFMKVSDIDVNKSFTELGLDSIIGVEWVKAINKQFGTHLSATRVYDHPSIKELALHLIGEMGAARASVAQAVADDPVASQPARFAEAAGVIPAEALPVTQCAAAASRPATAQAAVQAWAAQSRRTGIRFEPKYGPQFKSLYFYSADGEGDFEADGEFTLRFAINPQRNVCLKEHVVFGEHLLPTDAYIELVYASYRTYFSSGPVSLKNLAINSPILGEKGRDTQVKLVFRRSGDELQFFVRSSASPDFSHEQLHMQGFIALTDATVSRRFDEVFAIEQEIGGAAIPTNAGTHYAPLQMLRFGEAAALGQIHIAEHGFGFIANPFVLYGGLCTVINHAGWLAARYHGASSDQFLPYRLGRVQVLGRMDEADYRCHAQVLKLGHDAIEYGFEIVNGQGQPVMVVDSIVLRRVASHVLQQQAQALKRLPRSSVAPSPAAAPGSRAEEKIAIIGMSCRFPESESADAFWDNLKAGRDCVTEVPAGRWGAEADWYHPDPRHPHTSYSKWGGFLDRIDTFDALFFGISPAEAELIDPQQRIFLEQCWKAIENAGYAPSALSHQACGVYVGCASGDYTRVLAEEGQDSRGAAFMGSSTAILAARISYHLNLKGPALAVDTACSSSLVSVHLACESIRSGESPLALAGGINLLATPIGHILTSQVGMPSRDGRSAAFDASANGIVFSEGCGVLLLKALSQAERDNDNILGVIQGSGTNQDGKTNGITAPSSKAQVQLMQQVYSRFGIDPKRISYVEAHGTATPLGDPIEVSALNSVFGPAEAGRPHCALGSVKSNIGHTGFAAGVASMIKVLLCIQHRTLVPSIHYSQPNPHIEFETSPLRVNTQLREWVSDQARLATVSSFGFSGTNAHIVIEEHVASTDAAQPLAPSAFAPKERVFVPLSAKTEAQLRQAVRGLLSFVQRQQDTLDLTRLAHTLQLGRDGMDHRAGFIASSADELIEKLQAWLEGPAHTDGVYRGQASRNDELLATFAGDDEMRGLIERWLLRKDLPKIADLWVRGFELDWRPLYSGAPAGLAPRRMALPTYPFAQERCWVERSASPRSRGLRLAQGAVPVLHPLLHSNTSDLSQQSYTTRLIGNEFYLDDHRVNGQPVLPAVACLEMARAALTDAMRAEKVSLHLELRHVAWAQPITVAEPRSVTIAVFSEHGEQIEFEIYSHADGGDEVMHCQGSCVVPGAAGSSEFANLRLDLNALRAQMTQGRLTAAELYPVFAAMGLQYGPAFQGIAALHRGERQLLAELQLPDAARGAGAGFVLHPSLMDSALQGSIALINEAMELDATPSLPFAIESLRVISACSDRMVAWVRHSPGAPGTAASALTKIDIDLCEPDGKVCVQMRGFSSRPMEGSSSFDEAHYQSIIAGILSNEISADDALQLGNL